MGFSSSYNNHNTDGRKMGQEVRGEALRQVLLCLVAKLQKENVEGKEENLLFSLYFQLFDEVQWSVN